MNVKRLEPLPFKTANGKIVKPTSSRLSALQDPLTTFRDEVSSPNYPNFCVPLSKLILPLGKFSANPFAGEAKTIVQENENGRNCDLPVGLD
ncbi:hypothetical protein GG496_001995, partial [Candidatus Fervidibacteria bacterium JGI MDM2 JNZ-1-D12]